MKMISSLFVVGLCVFGLIIGGVSLTKNLGKSEKEITKESAQASIEKMIKKIDVNKAEPVKGQVDLDPADVASELPSINKFPLTVTGKGDVVVEIFSSTEKSGQGKEGWLNKVALDFNKAGIKVDGKKVNVSIRSIASGTATDFITTGTYIPQGFSPSNEFWGEMVQSSGVKTDMLNSRLVGNVAGIVTSKKKNKELIDEYGAVNIRNVTEAMKNDKFAMGYTDPFASSTGLNFLVSALSNYDAKNLLSEEARNGFESFQENVPFLASTTLQMKGAAQSGMLDGFVLEYQTYVNEKAINDRYEFTPFGARHDNPLYALGDVTSVEQKTLSEFAAFALQDKYQNDAKKDGFNGLDSYKSELPTVSGSVISDAQALWKEKKNGSKDIAAVFVTDVSGSMEGERLKKLKDSLQKGQSYLGKSNSIGLVSYSDDVTIELPIGKWNLEQQAYFSGAVESLQASGGTATFDGVVVAVDMLEKEIKKNPNTKPIIFVLSDGDTNKGHSLKQVRGLIEAYKFPVYTIGYDADIKALETLSSINEAASINADTDDVTYKIKQLFNVQM